MSATVASSASPGRLRVATALRRHVDLLQAAPFVALLGIGLATPLFLLFTYSFRESSFLGVGPGPTVEQYDRIFADPDTVSLVVRTLTIGLGVAAITTAFALVLAYGITFRFSRRAGMLALGVVIVAGIASFLVRIYAWGTILGTNGLINSALERLQIIDQPLGFLFFGYFAIVSTMVYLNLPIAALLVASAMQEVNPKEVEASRDLGAGRWRTALRVVAPQARVGLVAAFALTAIFASADYVTPQLVGGTKGQLAGTVVSTLALTNGNYPAAAALAISFLALLLLALAILAGIVWLTRRLRGALAVRMDQVAARITPLMPARLARVSLSKPLAIALLLYLITPTLVLLAFSFNSGATLGLPWRGFTLDWYPRIVEKQGFGESLSSSIRIAMTAVVGGVVIGVPMAFALTRATGRRAAVLRGLVFLPYLIPGVLLGVAVLVAATDLGYSLGLVPTTLVHMLIVTPLVALVVNARLTGLDPKLNEAARDLGASSVRVLRTITIPLILPSVVGASLIGAAYSLDEILATTFTIGTNNTIPIFLLGQARTGFNPEINALGVLMMFGTLVMFALAAAFMRAAILNLGSSRRRRGFAPTAPTEMENDS